MTERSTVHGQKVISLTNYELYKRRTQKEQDTNAERNKEKTQEKGETNNVNFNMAFTNVSIAKATFWLRLPQQKRGAFSMRNIKLALYNKFLADRIFSNSALDLSCVKIKLLYHKCLNTGALAA